MHEHIQCVSNDMLMAFGKDWLDENRIETYAVSVLRKIKEQPGISVFVDRPLYNDFETPDKLGLDLPEEVHTERFSWLQNRLIPTFKKWGCSDKQCELFLKENAFRILNFNSLKV